jgi:hypothetical protein
MIAVVFVLGPLDLILQRVAPMFAFLKWVMKLPTLSRQGQLLFNAIRTGSIGLGGIVILLLHPKGELSALLGISAISLVFLVLAVTEFLYWQKERKENRNGARQPNEPD